MTAAASKPLAGSRRDEEQRLADRAAWSEMRRPLAYVFAGELVLAAVVLVSADARAALATLGVELRAEPARVAFEFFHANGLEPFFEAFAVAVLALAGVQVSARRWPGDRRASAFVFAALALLFVGGLLVSQLAFDEPHAPILAGSRVVTLALARSLVQVTALALAWRLARRHDVFALATSVLFVWLGAETCFALAGWLLALAS